MFTRGDGDTRENAASFAEVIAVMSRLLWTVDRGPWTSVRHGGRADVLSLANGPMLAAVAVAAIALLLVQFSRRSTSAARAIFAGLAGGRGSVERSIDWEHLNALHVEVGATYSKLPNGQERAGYRKAFIDNFASAFRAKGGAVDAFRGWRVYGRDGEQVIVAADDPSRRQMLLLGLSGGWTKRLRSIQWKPASEGVVKRGSDAGDEVRE